MLLVRFVTCACTEEAYSDLMAQKFTLEAKEPPVHFVIAELADDAVRVRHGHERRLSLSWFKRMTGHWLAWTPSGKPARRKGD